MEDRVDILGKSLPLTYATDDKVDEFRAKRGVPLTWLEAKSVSFFMQFYGDLPDVTHVFDLGVGSAAAAIAAWRQGIYYDGVCANPTHKDWLDNLLDRHMYAVVAEGIGHEKLPGYDEDLQNKVKELFGPQVSEGMRVLLAQPQGNRARPARDSAEGDDEQADNAGEDDDDDV